MNGCVNFLLFSTLPNNQGAHCNPSGRLTQIEPRFSISARSEDDQEVEDV
jgi:hypothetical protein